MLSIDRNTVLLIRLTWYGDINRYGDIKQYGGGIVYSITIGDAIVDTNVDTIGDRIVDAWPFRSSEIVSETLSEMKILLIWRYQAIRRLYRWYLLAAFIVHDGDRSRYCGYSVYRWRSITMPYDGDQYNIVLVAQYLTMEIVTIYSILVALVRWRSLRCW